MPELDATIFGECQAMLLNFDELLEKEFGNKYCIRESLSFSLQLFPSTQSLVDAVKRNPAAKPIADFIQRFRSTVSPETLVSGKYSFKAFLIQVASNASTDALPIQFVQYDKLSDDQKKQLGHVVAMIKFKEMPVLNPNTMTPGAIVKKVQHGLGSQKISRGSSSIDKFTLDTHMRCWKKYKVAFAMLGKFGYSCDVACNGEEAVELARINRYDVVFMDLQMPVMDGLEATRRIVAMLAPNARPRIVAMTANALPGDRDRCIGAGMDDYLAKPILPGAVQALIERWAPRGRSAETPPQGMPLIDDSVLRELAALDEPGSPSLLRGLIRDYLAETPVAVRAIKQDFDQSGATELARRVHKLGGTSASLGATGVADVCNRIEQRLVASDLQSVSELIVELDLGFLRTRAELQKFA